MLHYLHTMIRVTNLEKSLHFYCEGLGFEVVKREEYKQERFTLAFLRPVKGDGTAPLLELTYNWDTAQYEPGNGYGHMAYQVDSIEKLQTHLKKQGLDLSWGPGLTPNGKRKMAFVEDPDGYEIELLEG